STRRTSDPDPSPTRRSSDLLKAFMDGLGGEIIVKPLDGCGGAGVFHLHRGDRNLNAILELSTLNGTRMVMAQRYLPAVTMRVPLDRESTRLNSSHVAISYAV